MRFFLRKQVLRTLAGAGVLLLLVLGLISIRTREKQYVPGETIEGLTASLARAAPADCPPLRFTDVTESSGIQFRHFSGVRANRLPEDMGSGVAVGDADGDGFPDLFLANTAGPLADRAAGWPESGARCALWRNRGDGTFEDATDHSGLGIKDLVMGGAWIDADNDADLDLFVTSFGRCRLFQNQGGLRFHDVSDAAGGAAPEGFWTGIACADHDCDGWVDVYVCGYVRYQERAHNATLIEQYSVEIPTLLNPSAFEPERNLLFHNHGGRFEEVAAAAGVDNLKGRSLAAVFTDLNGDLRPDLYVANDVSDNALFLNRGSGRFEDATYQCLVGDYRGAMGIAVGDIDGDLDQEMHVTHWVGQENALYRNMAHQLTAPPADPFHPIFMDVADEFGLGQVTLDRVGWATGFVDFDNDGWSDLFAINGSTIPRRDAPAELDPMKSQLFWNAGPERGFFEIGAECAPFFTRHAVGRGGAAFDYDLDGDQDLVVMVHGSGAVLLRNEGGPNHSLVLRLRQPEGNRFALGSRVLVRAGDEVRAAITDTQGSYLSQHATGEVHFGLGTAQRVDSIEVTWPDGETQSAGPFPADSLVTWVRGEDPQAGPLPGLAGRKPPVATQRQFYEVLDRASRQRIAGETDAAEQSYRAALALWPYHQDALYYLGNILWEQGNDALALETFETLSRVDPGASRAWMQLGRIRLPGGDPALDDLDQAQRHFTRAHQINAEETGPILELGVTALWRGDLAAADQRFAEAAASNHKSIEARYFRGLLAWMLGDARSAEAFLQEAHDLARSSGGNTSTLSEGNTRQGKAMVAAAGPERPLERWRGLEQRPVDPAAEFAELALALGERPPR